MESIVEFALYTWVAVSILAVLVQLVRIVRHRMSNAAKSHSRSADQETGNATIDLHKRMRGAPVDDSAVSLEELEQVEQRVSAVASSRGAPSSTPIPPAPPAPPAFPVAAGVPRPAAMPFDVPEIPDPSTKISIPTPGITPSQVEPTAAAADPAEASVTAADPEVGAPTSPARTLADILAGVRLPWNLLPTVDQAREPSNDRVVLMTDGVEPAEVGADVADELERLGFIISTRGEDTAIATRGDDVLGLQIVPEAGDASTGAEQRFPHASPTSVALDIWVEA